MHIVAMEQRQIAFSLRFRARMRCFRAIKFYLKRKKKKNFCFAVDMYLQFACCAAVPGGGRNKEYALHLLHMCKGNIHVRYFHFNFFISIPFYTTICKRSHFSLFPSIQFLKSRCLKERNEENEKNSKRFFISNGIIRALKIN